MINGSVIRELNVGCCRRQLADRLSERISRVEEAEHTALQAAAAARAEAQAARAHADEACAAYVDRGVPPAAVCQLSDPHHQRPMHPHQQEDHLQEQQQQQQQHRQQMTTDCCEQWVSCSMEAPEFARKTDH